MGQEAIAQIVTQIITFCNNKGGVGKTTSAVFIAYALALLGYRVLLIDMDPSCNSTFTTTGMLNEDYEGTLYEVLRERNPRPILDIIKPSRGHENLYVAPGSIWMQDTEVDLVSAELREFKLKNALAPVMGYFHYVIIDTPPNLNLLTINALIACTQIIIVVTLKVYGLVGISVLLKRLENLRQKFAPFGIHLPVLGVLMAQVRKTKNADARREQIQKKFGATVLPTEIPLNERVEEANDQEQPPFEFDPDAAGMKAYMQVTKEILSRVK